MTQQTNHIGDTNKMVTAVEWLLKNLKDKLSIEQANAIISQAKAMEKSQIMEAYDNGAIETMWEQEGLDISMDQNGEESGRYYNKKYNKL
jgi:uncharacterized Fe-S center protein